MQQQAAPNPMQMQANNEMARNFVVRNSLKMKQEIFSQTLDPASQNVINIGNNAIRYAGVLLGFIVEISGAIENTDGAAETLTRTPFGTANILKEIRFDDLSNYTRIQVPGWHLAMLNTARLGYGYGGVYSPNLPMDYGNNYDVFEGPATIAAGATADVRHVYYVPISYSNSDLRGSIYMNSVNANANLQLTINPTPTSEAGNPVDKLYTGTTGGWAGNVTVTVTQVYLSQIPTDQNGAPILPMMDLATTYDLKQTAFVGVTVGQDFPMQYSNERSFLSTFAVFDNGGVFNDGTDVNYWALRSANFTNLFKIGPKLAALDGRHSIMADFPSGVTYFESRDTPINTINFGNMELVLNASTANNGARVLVGFEAFALTNLVAGASSLGGG